MPTAIRERIVAVIAGEAIGWEHLPQADKTAMLGRWVIRADVGGALRPLLGTDAEVRMWIKDVALKRRARALLPTADAVARAALGDDARIRPKSAGIKPAHCIAATVDGSVYLCWDRAVNAKHLVWAAMLARDDQPRFHRVMVALIESAPSLTPLSDRARLERIAGRCGVEIRWIEL